VVDGKTLNHRVIVMDVVELLVKDYSVDTYAATDGDPIVFEVFTAAPQLFITDFHKLTKVIISVRTGKSGHTLLHYAVLTCCFQIVCFLVEECGADVNISNNYSSTPLHIAYMAGHTDIAQYLIQHGADVMAVDTYGKIRP